jgi:hypothetical protein
VTNSPLISRNADGTLVVHPDLAEAIAAIARQTVQVDADSVNRALRDLAAQLVALIDERAATTNIDARSVVRVEHEARPPMRRQVEHDAEGRIVAVTERPA